VSRSPVRGDSAEFEVRAAGGVLWRGENGAVEVALVHRPRYDDWTFPKGKVEKNETDEDAAWREVLEETGLSVEMGEELPFAVYADHKGRSKIVRYWVMTVVAGQFEVNEEVDQLDWLSVRDAHRRLTYDLDGDVLAAFAARFSND